MDCISTRLSYRKTNQFTRIVLDYVEQSEQLKSFYKYLPTIDGIKAAVEKRREFPTNRKILVEELHKQYADLATSTKVLENLGALNDENVFTITTAHQNNIFTGPLYFIYKILHTIRLADDLNTQLAPLKFVPVFYIGSEDADLAELNNINLGGQKLVWETNQKGAVGRMKVDKAFLDLIDTIGGQLSVLPGGKEIVEIISRCYTIGSSVEDATFKLVNELFGEYGLVVLLPDNARLKGLMRNIFEDDLFNQTGSTVVQQTAARLEAAGYKTQAHPREINLFYLKDDIRERIVEKNGQFRVHGTSLIFSKQELLGELEDHPDRFSPNVILRGLYQETILPNVSFIGGGGELAYWLELKDLFDHYKTPFPLLVLRNSFSIIEPAIHQKINSLGFVPEDFFENEEQLMNRLVTTKTIHEIRLNGNLTQAENLYEALKVQAAAVDETLAKHVDALKAQTISRLHELEKKMLRAEKKKFAAQQRQIRSIRERLFPNGGLQERSENFMYYYARWGSSFIRQLYHASLPLEQEFVQLIIE